MGTENVRGDIFSIFYSLDLSPSKETTMTASQSEECQTQTRKDSVFKSISPAIRIATEPAVLVLVPSPLHRREGHNPSPLLLWPPEGCKPDRWL